MGLFDHLFKSKSPPSEENSVETGSNSPEPAKHSESAARSAPQRADPSAFLHPKSFVPRGMTPLAPPKPGAASNVVSPSRKPGAPQPAAPAVEEIVLTLGDVLSRIPTPYLKLGQHDPKRELRFSINDLSSDIARGRAAVPLSRIARLVPDIFVKEIGPDEDSEVRLPLQKLVEQIGMLRSRPQPVDKTARIATTSTSASTQPSAALKIHFPEVETAAPGEETLRGMFTSVEPVFELKPMEGVVLDLPMGQEPAFVLKPVAESTDAPFSIVPEAPLSSAPADVAAEKSVVPERQAAEPVVAAVKESAGAPEAPAKWEGSAFESLLERAERIGKEPAPKIEETVETKPTEVPAAISVAQPSVPGDLPASGEPKLPVPEQGTAEGMRPSSETVSGTFEPLLPKREPVVSNAEPVQPGGETIPAVTEPIRAAKEIVINVAPAALPAAKPATSVAPVERPVEVSAIAAPLPSQLPLEPAPSSVTSASAPAESLQPISTPNTLPTESKVPAITPEQTSLAPLSAMAPPDSTPGSAEIPRISFHVTPAESPAPDVAVGPFPVESAAAPLSPIPAIPPLVDALAPSMGDQSDIPRTPVEPSALPPLESVAASEKPGRLPVESGPVATAPTAESASPVSMAVVPNQLPEESAANAAFPAPLEPAAPGLQPAQPPMEAAASPLTPPPLPGESAAPMAVPAQSVVQETAAPAPTSDHPPFEPIAATVASSLPVGAIAPWGAAPETARVESSMPVRESVESAGKPEDVSIEPAEDATAAGEGIVPSAQITAPEIPQTQKLAIRETPSGAEVGEEKIQLSLAAILRQCPREIIIGELPVVPDSVRITLPFAPIDRQLVMGHVEISAVRFIAAIPFTYQKFFTARMGVKVPIPLEEVFQNLPNPAKEVPVASGPPPLILAPAVPEDLPISEDEPGFTETTVPPIQAQTLHLAHQPEVAPPLVESAAAAVVSPVGVSPTSLIPTGENTPVDIVPPMESSSSIPAAKMEKIEKAEGGGEKHPAPEATVEPHALLETVTPVTPSAEAESTPPSAPAPLDLPAFHQFTPPPPSIAPEYESGEAVHAAASELAPEPVSPSDVVPESAESEIPKMVGGVVPSPIAPSAHELPAARISGTRPEAEAPASPAVEAAAPATVTPIEKLPEASILSEEPMTPPTASTETKPEDTTAQEEVAKPTEETSAPRDEPAAPPVEPPSLSVAGEDGNQTFRLPQIIRPFIVLPPPIFGFAPTPSVPESGEEQVTLEKEVASAITQKEEGGIIEVSGLEVLPKQDIAAEASSTVEPVEVVEPDAETPHRPGIINIDFAEALAPSGEAPAADLAPPGLSFEVPGAIPSVDLPPPVESIPSSKQEVPTPQEEAKPAEAPSGGITFAVTGHFTEPQTPEPTPVPMVASAAELAPEAATTVPPAELVPQALAAESVPTHDLAPEPSPAAEMPPVAESIPEPVVAPEASPAAETTPSGVEPEAPVLPSIVFEPTSEPAPEKLAASLSAPEADQDETTDGEPLLHQPKIIEQFSATEVLPPALPLRRFDQDALQALFMTEDTLDLPKISRLAAQLPGVHACVIATRDQACTGGTLPEGFDLAALLGLAPRVGEAAGRMPIGDLKHFTLYGERYSVSFFARNGLSLCAVHRPRSFVPGVREKLVAIADELSK